MSLTLKFKFNKIIRNFFDGQGFLEVTPPPAQENPGMEVHIHPFQLFSVKNQKVYPFYLHTSPEFSLKEFLVKEHQESQKIYSLGYCFRDEPQSPFHRFQFLMLEWYEVEANYDKIAEQTVSLIKFCHQELSKLSAVINLPAPIIKTVEEIFREILQINILDYLEKDSLKELIINQFPGVPLPSNDCAWDDYYFLLFLNKIEPQLDRYPFLVLKEFPAPLAALAELKKEDPRVALRFEIYLNGVELCNCFQELRDYPEQEKRFSYHANEKQHLYGYKLNHPQRFLNSMKSGLPFSSGNALGVERLMSLLLGKKETMFWD